MLAASTQVRCVDAAREAARLTARGDNARAVSAAKGVAPPGAMIEVGVVGDSARATVTATTALLPGLRLRATASAVLEPGVGS
ncbi:hypothetical protein GCM10011591_36150 [Nocardia camponoti]|uniref:Pilus assembly protein TadE n=1 Tax=Nocardia camponoti TaxID=1616106 RepID=A0A917QN63_9NOCA|nr:hypothetical protein GCM10011591_36150 [Nocardia camponoti]